MSTRITGELQVTGNMTRGGALRPDVPRANLALESLAPFPVPWAAWRIHDAFHTLLPGAGGSGDLGLVGGTFGTGAPSLQTEDLKAEGATDRRARAVVSLPENYEPDGQVRVVLHAGMLTTVADDSAVVDVEAFQLDGEGGVAGGDLVTTDPITINSLTLAAKEFILNPSGLDPGDQIDLRITVSVNDGATATEVKAIVGLAVLECDVRG